MSVLLDADADNLTRTANLLDYNVAYTISFWLYQTADRNTYSHMLNQNESQSNYDGFITGSNGTILTIETAVGGGYAETTGTDLSLNTWYFGAIVRSNNTTLLAYLGTPTTTASLDFTHTHASVSGRSASTVARFNDNALWADPWRGRIAAVKQWSTNLSLSEIVTEQFTILPRKIASLHGFYPCFPGATERLRDYSGLGRNFTGGGTLTDAAAPPITWGVHSSIHAPVTAAAPAGGDGNAAIIRSIKRRRAPLIRM